jgi:cephalosporin hydroxylase
MPAMQQIWHSESEGELAGVPVRWVNSDFQAHRTSENEIVVLKPGWMIADYRRLAPDPQRIVEVGVFQGGSALLMADMFPSANILGVDFARGNPAIEYHMRRLGYSHRMRLHFGVSQDDPRLGGIVENAFRGEQPDLIIDDASHNYGCTTRCFDILFPRLAVGGLYVIEDWGWSYWPGYQPAPSLSAGGIPLSDMIHELLAASAIYGTIAVERVQGSLAAFRKRGELPPFAEIRAAARRSP